LSADNLATQVNTKENVLHVCDKSYHKNKFHLTFSINKPSEELQGQLNDFALDTIFNTFQESVFNP